jgi:hypothetical protein
MNQYSNEIFSFSYIIPTRLELEPNKHKLTLIINFLFSKKVIREIRSNSR